MHLTIKRNILEIEIKGPCHQILHKLRFSITFIHVEVSSVIQTKTLGMQSTFCIVICNLPLAVVFLYYPEKRLFPLSTSGSNIL